MIARIALLVCFSFSLVACGSEPLYFAETIRIIDGDTIEVLTEERKAVRIRLNAIDAPETKQSFSAKSTEALGQLTFRKTVRVVPTGRDRYRRALADINLGDHRRGLRMALRPIQRRNRTCDLSTHGEGQEDGLWSLPDLRCSLGLAKATQIGKETKMTERVTRYRDIQNACPSIITCEIVRHGPF
ncbi:thermonuclease family protein [Rhodopirellula baltica]|uniref:Nuclease (SNase-like) n=1 Tax=Rhodopirellula baltica SWK14 TaxID=993516 RepID=L7CNC9_RHOBT|nr:thermonuclease family protein [Rhodopirellula baltica]ELP34551.1 nuclease (SNase-like) [Rhodopirellula baltica SWK14]